jgi:glycine/D-amino acid oxidase-like deaminating enzyme
MAADHRALSWPKGLWLDFGHPHLGLMLGPITGRPDGLIKSLI